MGRKEDYLKTIYKLADGKGIRNIDIANSLGISKSSVSEMLRKLARQELIELKPYSKVYLTKKGEKIGKRLNNKYEIIEEFIEKNIGYEELDRREIMKLMNAFSEDSIKKIEKRLKQPRSEKTFQNYIG